ncbi:MAG: discoidin domain-containing protein [Candidatus Hodarchaeota archaeon]
MKVKRIIFAMLMFVTIWLATTAFSGTGKIISGSPHLIDLNVYYSYNETDMDIFKNAFIEASRLMFNSTDGQMQFGTIRVSENSAFQNKADFWVLLGDGNANSGGFGVLGNAGSHVTIYREQHRFTSEDGPDGNERGQFGIVHELGHHAFDLRNEYHGGPPSYASGRYCISTTSNDVCIMDGGTAVHPTHHRTEWCTDPADSLSTAHITSPENHQESHHGEACWETIADYCSSTYGITMSEPTTVNTSDPAGHVAPAWIIIGDDLRYVICLDKSYSMHGSRLDKAQHGGELFVDLGHEGSGEFLAVTSFSGGVGYDPPADVDFSLTEIITDTVKDNARTAIGGISVENMTAIGDGMRVSLDELETMAQDDACVEAIVLLSDGAHNYGSGYGYDDPDDVIPDLRDRGVRVFTIGLGDPADPVYPLDEPMLQHIADETGGLYTHAPTEASLATIYTTYCAEIRGADVCSEETGEFSGEEYGYEYEKAYVDEFTNEATFVLHWPTGGHAFDLELESPDGTIIDPATAVADPRIKYVQMDYYEFYRVMKPMTGTWILWIRGVEQPSGIPYTTQTLAEAPGVDFSVFVKKHLFEYPEVPVIQASLAAGPHVTGAKIDGLVFRPHPDVNMVDTVPIELYDDGLYVHGDDMPDDGIYSNRFFEFPYDGSYQFHLTARNETGTEATPDEPVSPDWTPAPIPKFDRVSKNTIIIQGLPEQFPVPSIKTVTPSEGKRGETLRVTVTGYNFVNNALVTFLRSGITINRLDYVNSQQLIAYITIDPNAILGTKDVKVTNPGGESYTAKRAFTVEALNYPIENITATASSLFYEKTGPENTINYSGMDANDLHSTDEMAMWLSGNEPRGAWIEYDFDKVYKLYQMWVWNSNQTIEPFIGYGFKNVTIEYSTDGINYTKLGTTHEFVQAPGADGYAHNTTIDFGGAEAKYVRLTANSNWGGFIPQYGLSEVRFFYIPESLN